MQRNKLAFTSNENNLVTDIDNTYYCIGELTKVGKVSGLFVKLQKYNLPTDFILQSLKPDENGQLLVFKNRDDAISCSNVVSKKDYSNDPIPGLLNYYANYRPIFTVTLDSTAALEKTDIHLDIPDTLNGKRIIHSENFPCFKILAANVKVIQDAYYLCGLAGDIQKFERIFSASESEKYLNEIKNSNVLKLK